MNAKLRIALAVLAPALIFWGGYAASQSKFGQPKTIIHISLIKWKADASDADKQKALDGVKGMAAQIPGIKNIWLKAVRMQPRDYHAALGIEVEHSAAADRYAERRAHARRSTQARA